jgi:hypothetical protein
MKIKTLFVTNALVSTFFGLSLLLFPFQLYTLYGQQIDPGHANTARLWGASVLGYALLTWSARNMQDTPTRRMLVRVMFGVMTLGFLAAFFTHLITPQPLFAWTTPIIYLLLAGGYGYFLFRKT